jgi:hypothetical protein
MIGVIVVLFLSGLARRYGVIEVSKYPDVDALFVGAD